MVFEASVLEDLGVRYGAAGATAWGVWVQEHDTVAAAVLTRAGLTVDSRPTAMALDLAALGPAPGRDGVTVERTDDLALIAGPLSASYGFPAALLTSGLPGLLDQVEGWVGRVGGIPAAAVVVVRAGGDGGVFMVGTAPELRRRGAAGEALHHSLLRARDDGCTTSTLQSSSMGRSVYARIGYADLGVYQLWERRTG
jgi:GNAT superfamily N-acetyltransferase